MEIAIPLLGLGSLYVISNQNKEPAPAPQARRMEGFQTYTSGAGAAALPNTNIPDKNYPDSAVQTQALDQTAELSVINRYTPGVTPTDKYFTVGANGFVGAAAPTVAPGGKNRTYQSLTGDQVTIDQFSHNNMVPYFGSNVRGRTGDANRYEGMLDSYTGAGSQIINKTEQAPLFKPDEHTQYAYGAPNLNDFYQTRVVPSQSMNGVKPFASQQVGPGLGLAADGVAAGGFNAGMEARELWQPKTVDQLRAQSNPKSSEFGLLGYEGAPRHYVTNSADQEAIGRFEKNRPDTHFEMSQDRYFRTTGMAQSAPIGDQLAIAAEIVEKHVSRPETTTSYTGIAAPGTEQSYTTGMYMPSHRNQLDGPDFTPASRSGAGGAREGDYSLASNKAYANNRTANAPTAGGDNWFAGVGMGGAIGAVIAPLLDVLRPSRKENTVGTIRPYQNPTTSVKNSYVYNPNDRLPTTIRETTGPARNLNTVNRNQQGGAYMVTENQAVDTNRLYQTTSYSGGAAATDARAPMRYDHYNLQRNNEIKSSTVTGYTPAGGMSLLNSNMNPTALRNDASERNTREWSTNRGPSLPTGADGFGILNGTTERMSSNIGYERNNPDITKQILKQNPYTNSYFGV